jgi:Rrf2 family nitric oxide-sensitive transcriptional repressor
LRAVPRDADEAFFRELDPFMVADLTWSPTADVPLSLLVRPAG